MNRFLKLAHMEVHRFRYALGALMGLTAICQISLIYYYVNVQLNAFEQNILQSGQQYELRLSFAGMLAGTQPLFALPIAVAIAALLLYVFLIWYRDWFGRSTFMIRQLMLPTARRHLYLAKLTALLGFVFGLVAYQLAMLVLLRWLFKLRVPASMFEPSYLAEAIEANQILSVLLPRTFDQFAVSYGLGILGVLVAFTAVLLERSYRWKGIFYAILYVAACLFVFVLPILFDINYSGPYWYPEEVFGLQLAACGLIAGVSVWLGFRLLNKKITV
ncbi:hypothetical protein ACF3MZ_09755 [Paenibacillaceae bacterium WGS1546]|uniref:hypothetical protein n=1 Tax=Cohnella sp. WGS1546 TaxID=3366810 RepID=UPI00372D4A6E